MSLRIVSALLALALLADAQSPPDLFARDNLIAWCLVPFDAKQRGPEERAAMLEKLGFKDFAYDYREEHIPTWDAELDALQRHHVSLDAWWFPTALNEEARQTLDLFQRHGVHPQLWVMGGGVTNVGIVYNLHHGHDTLVESAGLATECGQRATGRGADHSRGES